MASNRVCFIRPGMTCGELYYLMATILQDNDRNHLSNDVGRFGHGLGIALTEKPSIISWSDYILKENMVMTLEPAFSYAAGKMLVHEENILITQDGATLLTKRAPSEIPVIM